MSDGVTFKLTGGRELARILEDKPPRVAREIIRDDLRKAASVWREEMRARVRRGWHIFATTRVKGVRFKKGRMSFEGRSRDFGVIARAIALRTEIGAGGYSGAAYVYPSKRTFWAHFLEFGTAKMRAFPFIRVTFEVRKGQVLDVFIEGVRAKLTKELGAR